MKQVLLYSINPEHLANILNGHKTIEVRKRDLPQWAKDKLARGEKVVGYGYCTKAEPYLNKDMGNWFLVRGIDYIGYPVLNGLVVVKFEVDKILTFKPIYGGGYMYMNSRDYVGTTYNNVLEKACLTSEQLEAYGNGKDLYAHHLTNITPIEPMGLGELQTRYLIEETLKWHGEFEYVYQPLTKAPQSFMTCWVKE